MKLTAERQPYSSVVGGGLQLVDEAGRVRFMVMICGTTEGISKAEDQAISNRLAELINEHGLIITVDGPVERTET